MSETTAHFLSGQLEAYTESWHRDHIDALACWELEARLEVAIALFHVIRRMDEEMCQQVAAGRLRWDVPAADQLLGFYRAWEAPADQIAHHVLALRAKGFEVQGAQAFEQATLQAKSTLNIPMDRLEHSARQAQEGNLRPLGEVRNVLRRQSDPRC